jgi:LPXTG-site transpeptidase (sortase) family protein
VSKQKKILTFICLLLALDGIFIVGYEYINKKILIAYDDMSVDIFMKENKNVVVEEENKKVTKEKEIKVEVQETKKVETKKEIYDYVAILEIPKIELKKGLVDINSKDNKVSKNIQIMKSSNFPDVDKGVFILASHSGTLKVSYFSKLYKVKTGDYVYVYYNNVKYIYKITKITYIAKTGMLPIERDPNKTSIVLITCTYGNKKTQTVYTGELVKKEGY